MLTTELQILLQAAELVGFFGSAGFVLFRLGRAVQRFEEIGVQQGKEITKLEEAVKNNSEVIVKVAVQQTQLADQSARLTRMEMLIDDLRRGEGMILPLDLRRALESK